MFSANENIQLRREKKKIVAWIEELIGDDLLDSGTSVMVMQVACNAPGCVPQETAIVIVFPGVDSLDEATASRLRQGLAETGSYKAKILKPMAEVTLEDVRAALPAALGGERTPAAVSEGLWTVWEAQLEQAECYASTRVQVAASLREKLERYIANGGVGGGEVEQESTAQETSSIIVDDAATEGGGGLKSSTIMSVTQQRQQQAVDRLLHRQAMFATEEGSTLCRLGQQEKQRSPFLKGRTASCACAGCLTTPW